MICNHCGYHNEKKEKFCPICGELIQPNPDKKIRLYPNQKMKMDLMSGIEFEEFCCRLLIKNGFHNLKKTKRTGDHGADIIAEKDDISFAIQCKCYRKPVGNKAVQEAYTAKMLYHTDIAVIMTNRTCTPQAKEEAKALGVKIWDRRKIITFIES